MEELSKLTVLLGGWKCRTICTHQNRWTWYLMDFKHSLYAMQSFTFEMTIKIVPDAGK